MTYLNFLLLFIVTAVLLAALVTVWDARRGRQLPSSLRARAAGPPAIAADFSPTSPDSVQLAVGVPQLVEVYAYF